MPKANPHAVQTRIPEPQYKMLEARAAKEGISVADYVRRLLLNHLNPSKN
jgi:predicted HicB family RNase H-like nuclease